MIRRAAARGARFLDASACPSPSLAIRSRSLDKLYNHLQGGDNCTGRMYGRAGGAADVDPRRSGA